jgi:putative acetyltransferase
LIALKRDSMRRVNARDYSPMQVEAWAPEESAIDAWPARLAGRRVVVAVDDRDEAIGFGDLGPDGHIDQFCVHADPQRRGVGRPFFGAHGFVVDAEQTVTARGVAFPNFRMSRLRPP